MKKIIMKNKNYISSSWKRKNLNKGFNNKMNKSHCNHRKSISWQKNKNKVKKQKILIKFQKLARLQLNSARYQCKLLILYILKKLKQILSGKPEMWFQESRMQVPQLEQQLLQKKDSLILRDNWKRKHKKEKLLRKLFLN